MMKQCLLTTVAGLAGACMFLSPSTAEAQRFGVNVQGPGFSIGTGNYNRGYPGAYPGGYNRGYYGGNYGSGYNRGYGYGYPGYMNRGYYPGYSSNYYVPSTSYYAPSTSYYYEPAAQTQPANNAQFIVRLPHPNAEVWIDGRGTSQTGTERVFQSPTLTPGYEYTFTFRARWFDENGQTVERSRSVTFRPGQSVNVDFTQG